MTTTQWQYLEKRPHPWRHTLKERDLDLLPLG